MLRDAFDREQLKKIRKLYEESFPKSEKKPFAFMLKKRKEGFFDILCIEDEKGAFCGLAIMMLSGEWALLDYLAIAPDCQGAGVGSRTLRELQERYGKERIVVEIEDTTGLAESCGENPEKRPANAQERLRRKRFYLRNGMSPMDFLVELFGVEMEVLTFGGTLTFEEYYAIYANVLPACLARKVRKVQ